MSEYTVAWPDYEASLEDEPYRFYLLGVWVRTDGYYIATDSGCSCPSPWESHTEEELTGPLTFGQVAEEASALTEGSEYAISEVGRLLTVLLREQP